MQITISGRHGHLSPETQQLLRQKAERLLHVFERLTAIEVVVDHEHDLHTVELKLDAEHKHDFVAKEKAADLQAAMELVLDKAETQLRKHKEKLQDHRRRPALHEGAPAKAGDEA